MKPQPPRTAPPPQTILSRPRNSSSPFSGLLPILSALESTRRLMSSLFLPDLTMRELRELKCSAGFGRLMDWFLSNFVFVVRFGRPQRGAIKVMLLSVCPPCTISGLGPILKIVISNQVHQSLKINRSDPDTDHRSFWVFNCCLNGHN